MLIIPKSAQGAKLKYPWDILKVGEYYMEDCKDQSDRIKRRSVLLTSARAYATRNNPDMKFVSRNCDGNKLSIFRIQ